MVDAVAMELETNLHLTDEKEKMETEDDESSDDANGLALHPARSMPFDELYTIASTYVESKKIERSLDTETGLEIYSYFTPAFVVADNGSKSMKRYHSEMKAKISSYYDNDIVLTNLEDMQKVMDSLSLESSQYAGCSEQSCGCCDGLAHCRRCWILIGAGFTKCHYCLRNQSDIYNSSTRVGAGEDLSSEGEDDPTLSMFRGLILHPQSKTVIATPFVRFFKSKMFDLNARANRVVRASVKYDGSLIIAFKWQGDLFTSTRRRMNSEQAAVARDILRQSALAQREFKEGWTYLLELVGGNNVHLSQYPIAQCLVLLSVYNSSGVEVDFSERVSIAERAGLLYPTTIYGYIKDIANIAQGRGGIVCEAPAGSEGWVVEDPMDGARFKMINSNWDKTSIAVKSLVHPCVVWRSLLMCNFQTLQSNPNLPNHARKEMNLMADAIINNALSPIRNLIHKHFNTSCANETVYDTWPRASSSSKWAFSLCKDTKADVSDILDEDCENDIALTNCEDFYKITSYLADESNRHFGCDGHSCGSCQGLAHCKKCWILIAAGFTECFYCLHEGSSYPLRLRDMTTSLSKRQVSQTSMVTAVMMKNPITAVSILALADEMEAPMDMEDILARSTTPPQWAISSMLPSDEELPIYSHSLSSYSKV